MELKQVYKARSGNWVSFNGDNATYEVYQLEDGNARKRVVIARDSDYAVNALQVAKMYADTYL